jgi:hypothetical protein
MSVSRGVGVWVVGIGLLAGSAVAADHGKTAKAAEKSVAKTVSGNVVDAACFMIHPQAADTPSHHECGTACMKNGVPLAIAAEDGSLYFPADGNKQLAALHGQQVKATGIVSVKSDPMELKMPVGQHNTMTVKVEGGYSVIDIHTLVKAAK